MKKSKTIHLIAQKGSPLGTARHIACVERRLRGGQAGAYVAGAARYLTHEALAEELAEPPSKKGKPHRGRLDAIQRELVGVKFLGKVQ